VRHSFPPTSPYWVLLGSALSGFLLLAGCAGPAATTDSAPLPEAFPNHSAQQIRSLVAAEGDTVDSFAAKARVTLRSPEDNQSGSARVRQRRSDSLFMNFSKFGIEGARLLLTPDSILYFDTRKNVLRTGSIAAAQRLLPAPLTSGEVFQNLLGLLRPESTVDWSVEADSSYYYLRDPSGRTQITVDPARWRIIRYARETEAGDVLDERLFTDFRRVEGLLLPQRVIFRRPADGILAVLRYQEIDLNPSELSLGLDVPSETPRKPLR